MGTAGAALAIGLAMWGNLGSQVRLEVEEAKARTVATDEKASILILELRVKNPAQVPFVVREVRVKALTPQGEANGLPVAEPDLDRVLDYYKHLGPRYNSTLKVKERIGGGTQLDKTVAASFEIAEQTLIQRSGVVLEIEDVDGAVVTARLK